MQRMMIGGGIALALCAATSVVFGQPWAAFPKGVVSGAALAQCDIDQNNITSNCQVLFEEPTGKGLGDYALARAQAHIDMDVATSPPGKVLVSVSVDEFSNSIHSDPNLAKLVPKSPASLKVARGVAILRCTPRVNLSLACQIAAESPASSGLGLAALERVAILHADPNDKYSQPIYMEYHFATDTGTKPVEWIAQPTASQLAKIYPGRAAESGVGGKANLQCLADKTGSLKSCWVLDESPSGLGFGQAALGLSKDFRFKAATVGGKSVEALVTVPVRFDPPGAVVGTGNLVTRPIWLSVPSAADVAGAWSPLLTGEGADVVLRCEVTTSGVPTACKSRATAPVNIAYTSAAIKLAGRFKMQIPTQNGRAMKNLVVDLPIRLSPPIARTKPLSDVPYTASPSRQDLASILANANLPADAVAQLTCTIDQRGKLTNCQILAESAEGAGAVLLTAVDKFQAGPWSGDGLPTAGATTNFILSAQ